MNLSITKARLTYNFKVNSFDNEAIEEIINKLKEVLLDNINVPDKAFMYFISILQAICSYKHILGKEYKRQAKSRMKDLIIDEPIAKYVRKSVASTEADVLY